MLSTELVPSRPWFLSVTAVLQDAEGFEQLKSELNDKVQWEHKIPGHQIIIRETSWHFTVFAILKINGWISAINSLEEYAAYLQKQLIENDPNIFNEMRSSYMPISIEAYEIRSYDTVTALQFKEIDNSLSSFRARLKDLLKEPVHKLCLIENQKYSSSISVKPLVEALVDDPNKNFGGNAFGSITRSPNQIEKNALRWQKTINRIKLKFHKIYLLYSDDMLTNPGAIEGAIIINSMSE